MNLLVSLLFSLVSVGAFVLPRTPSHPSWLGNGVLAAGDESEMQVQEAMKRSNLDKFLELKYPQFYALVGKNDEIGDAINKNNNITVFCPNSEAFQELGAEKLTQLNDPRNLEAAERIVSYHVILDEAVPRTRLYQEDWTAPKTPKGNPELSYRGIMTAGGEVAVGRTKSGGFLGLFREEDGGVLIGGKGRIVQSFEVGGSYVHEVDSVISPDLLFRYLDQLRIKIPGL
mmetsp:Transcript_19894/g.29440  ORF Transcript_19894/g.29440 Transcript_19894/m.29440 type:complete len:229 (-) Transcript_19894:135-821(-)